jgi:hypothetical protein
VIEFRLIGEDDETALPDISSFSLSPVLCDAGALEFTYPRDGQNWQLIRDLDEFKVAVYIDGVRQPRLDAWVKEVDGDDAEDASVWKFTGHLNNGRLAEALVYPKNWPDFNPEDVKQQFAGVTPGAIVKTLIQQAQDRGTLLEVTTSSFTSTLDSNGDPWEFVLNMEYAPQLDYLEVVRNLYEQRVAEFEMVGDDLRLYNFEANAVDHTLEDPPLVFRRGRDLSDSPRKRSTRELGTVMLAAGAEGVYAERVDASGVATRRRIERKASQGQVKDEGTLIAFADAELSRISQPKMEKTHGLVFGEDASPRPIRDFDVGDWAFSDMGSGLERLRVKQWVLAYSDSGELTGSVSLNDLFAEQNEVLSRRIQGIVGGSTITGGSQARPAEEGPDTVKPAQPSAPVLSSLAYMDDQGHTFAQVSASWLPVTTNEDTTVIEDLAGYRVRWQRQGDSAWQIIGDIGNATATSWSPVAPAVDINVQVQAYDRNGNESLWSPSGTIFTADDATPPEMPHFPTMDNYLGLLRIEWDGTTNSGAAWAPDFSHVEVHIGTVNGFIPTYGPGGTFYDVLPSKGASFYEAPYGVTHYARLIAVDYSGNKSAPSASSLGKSSSQVVSPDIFDGAVGTAKLADLAVVTAKIADLAVNDAKIGSVSVGKLTAGIINAEVTISGRIGTALTGARREMNGLGFQAWDSGNNLLINLDGVSNLLTGIFKTARTGRRIEIGAGGATGEITFYAPNGSTSFVRAFTESTGNEAIQFGVQISGVASTLWNRWNLNTEEWSQLRSNKVDMYYGEYFIIRYTPNRGGSSYGTYQATATEHRWWVGDVDVEGSAAIVRHGVADSRLRSPRVQVITETTAGGSVFGGHMKFVIDGGLNGPWTNGRLEFTNVTDSGYENLWANSFVVSSSRVHKANIRDMEAGSLDVVRRMRLRRWSTKEQVAARPIQPKDQTGAFKKASAAAKRLPEERMGIVAEEAPEDLVRGNSEAIDLAAWLARNTGAIQELADMVDDIQRRFGGEEE